MVLTEFVEKIYLSYIELVSRSCASSRKRDVGKSGTTTSAIVSGIFACMSSDGCKQMLKAIAEDNDLSKTTLQHIKSNTE